MFPLPADADQTLSVEGAGVTLHGGGAFLSGSGILIFTGTVSQYQAPAVHAD